MKQFPIQFAILLGVTIYMGPMWRLITQLIRLCSFLFQIWRYYAIATINSRSQSLGQEKENILHHFLFGDKTNQNFFKIDATREQDNGFLLKQETQKCCMYSRLI